MAVPIFDFIATMERDIADFYRKLRSVGQLSSSVQVFEFMSDHSIGHADTVARLSGKYVKPELDQNFVRNVHEQIKTTLFNEITAAEDIPAAIEKMARTEELVGKLYAVVSDHYARLAEYYMNISKEIGAISEEEFQHRDMILKEKGKY
ncbi:MAG: hypothetical protein ACRCZU_12430 [Selenomonadaceae bacterium]